ncbi:pilus assembly protein PilE [Pseudoxanthomonas sp. Root630]|nr:pilus assembly protein PilE [Pseudoxanthomonas sp. Root630]
MKKRSEGFTLMELMIAIAVVGILAAIAYPSYTGQVTKTRRSAAAACLLERAQFMERYYSTNMGYTGAALPAAACATELGTHYTFAFSAGPTATTYTLAATPQGGQASNDTQCATLSINERGTKSVSGSYSSTPSNCF